MSSVKVPIKVQRLSGFDKSHHNALTQQIGRIVPVLVDEVIPNTKVYLRFALAGSMAPLATDAYMKCYYDVRAFFVPFRLLSGSFESWFSDYSYPVVANDNGTNVISQRKGFLPVLRITMTPEDSAYTMGANSLADYLGYKVLPSQFAEKQNAFFITAMPFLAYHKICNDWYRQPNVTKEYFARPSGVTGRISVRGGSQFGAAMCPFVSHETIEDAYISVNNTEDDSGFLADNVHILSLRSQNYDYDYFTNALPSAQLGQPMSVASSASFTISSLRVANSLQQFAELNQLAGSNLVDVVKARYGANLSRGVAQRCIYLGGCRVDIGTKSVDNNTGVMGSNLNNPFASILGSTGGRAVVQGTDLIIDNFVTDEPGYIFVMGSIVPKVTYGTGIRRYLRHYISAGSLVDMANPMLQNVGNQPIYQYELDGGLGAGSESLVFGYTDRYAEFMTYEDEVHGLMRSEESLQHFVAQRVFISGRPLTIGSSFLEIPITALNNVSAVGSQVTDYGFYGQFAFDYKVSMPLAQYSLPSLQNPAYEHGKTVMVHRGGFRF